MDVTVRYRPTAMRRALIAIVVGSFVAAACAGTSTTGPSPSGIATTSANIGSTRPPDGPPETNPSGEPARLVRAFDGDSMDVEIDGDIFEVRMIGINAPERDECHGDVARDALIDLLEGRDLILETGDEATDQYGRLLRYVWLDGEEANAAMIGLGHAIAIQNGHPHEAEYSRLVEDAAEAHLGMWAPDACGQGGDYSLRVEAPEYDPPGRDGENALNEWVEITNTGGEAVDMTGWTLRDESTQHRYRFDSITVPAGKSVRVRTGCGDDRALDLVWCADDAVWSNGGDTVIVQDSAGNVVTWLTYRGAY